MVDDLKWENICMKKVQNYVALYSNFEIFSLTIKGRFHCFCAVSHSKYISIFNITSWKWINHLEFEDDILYLLSHKYSKMVYMPEIGYDTQKNVLSPACITKKGWIYLDFMLDDGNYKSVITELDKSFAIDGEIVKVSEDTEN